MSAYRIATDYIVVVITLKTLYYNARWGLILQTYKMCINNDAFYESRESIKKKHNMTKISHLKTER